MLKSLGFCMLLLVLAGCASGPTTSIGLAVVDDVSVAQARADAEAHRGARVRWGGIVTEVENKADETWVFVVARELRNNEKPISDSDSEGRFIASFEGFIDPLVYQEGRPLSVVGSFEGSTVRSIGDFDYRFPIVKVTDSHLWADPEKTRVYYPPPPYWYYDMYYYHPYPYRHPRW